MNALDNQNSPLFDGRNNFGGQGISSQASEWHLHLRQALFALVVILAIGGIGYGGWMYVKKWQFQISTDDAYVQADVVSIAPEVSGYIKAVPVVDNQVVHTGDILASIDPSDFQAAVDQAGASVAMAVAAIDGVKAQLQEQQALIDEARATVVADQAAAVYAQQNDTRYGKLASDGYGSQQNAEQAKSQIASSTAVVLKDKAALEATIKQVATLTAQLASANATLGHNKALLRQSQLNLGYTILRSPVDGVVGARSLRVGQYVQPGTLLLAVVPLAATYVVANYKETQLAYVKPGQQAGIVVDTYPGAAVRGKVNSVAPASGQEFALLPPDNATGNFTKIVQRIPVKISIDRSDPLAGRLRPGMSVTATIDTVASPPASSR